MAGKRKGAPENMRPPKTKEEAKERGYNGGVKSGIVRRKKRSIREAFKTLMDMPVSFENIQEQMRGLGFEDEDLTNLMAIAVSMFKEAMAGNVKAAELIRDIIGGDAADDARREKLKMDRERLEMENKRLEAQLENDGKTGDGMPVIINVRPEHDK